jgi:hypothetical protein
MRVSVSGSPKIFSQRWKPSGGEGQWQKRKDYSGQAFGRVVDNNRGKRARTPPCRMNGARGGAPEGKRNGNYRHDTGLPCCTRSPFPAIAWSPRCSPLVFRVIVVRHASSSTRLPTTRQYLGRLPCGEGQRSKPGSLAMFAAMRRGSLRVSAFHCGCDLI